MVAVMLSLLGRTLPAKGHALYSVHVGKVLKAFSQESEIIEYILARVRQV